MVRLSNGSLIEAFPNNPETIRGPTLDIVYCDEMNFIADDEELYDAVLFTLATTNGKFACTSTPWTTNSLFWKIFNNEAFSDFATSHVTWKQALEPNGPMKKSWADKIRKQFKGDQLLLRHCHQFKLGKPYATIIGHMKVLSDCWNRIHASALDKTGLGDYIVEDSRRAGIPEVTGVNFTETKKEEMATALKQQMVNGKLWIPYDEHLINELNVERFELTKTGRIRFSHPSGSHDDRFWAVALAVYAATVERKPPPQRPMAVSG